MPKEFTRISATPPNLDASTTRASVAGTARYRQRFQASYGDDYFRTIAGDLIVSSIGIGTYLGDSTTADDTAYQTSIRHAIASGINVLDTAINYRSQRSERNVATAVQQAIAAGEASREALVICTKGGYIPLDGTPPATREEYQAYVRREFIDREILRPDEIVGGGHSLAPRFLRYCLAKSRQNLALRTIDIYYLHNPGQFLSAVSPEDGRAHLKAAFAVLEEAAARGEIGGYGCATWDELRVAAGVRGHLSLEQTVGIARELAGDAHHFTTVQLPINLAMLEAVRPHTQVLDGAPVTTLEACAELGLNVVASASLMQGRLAQGLPETVRSHFPAMESDAQRAVAFIRTLPGVTTALVGMKQTAHVDEITRAAQPGSTNG